jgi:chromosomal replication initiator protein
VEWWRARYRRATALLLDDVHLLAGKDRTQEELFNLFNLFLDKDRQLVFTAPGSPNTLTGLEDRIRSRLEGGLVVELGEPDRGVRRGLLERWLADQRIGGDGDAALIDYLADRPVDSIRTLVSLAQRVIATAAERAVPVTAALAREVLAGAGPERGAARRTGGLRTSGLVVSTAGGIRSREKIVWDWPDQTERILEDLR